MTPTTGTSPPSRGHSTVTTPVAPSTMPSHCWPVGRSPSSGIASAAVSTGWVLTISEASPAGMPREMAKNTPPR